MAIEISEKKPLVSIITVVFNSELYLEKTILSIINQEYVNFEFIIIDGGSTDNTLEIIKKYENFITKWICEKDSGLYDAMNKGISLAKGNYLWFINSGDEIYNLTVLEDIFLNEINYPDIIYGETEIINYKGQSLGMRRHSTPEVLNWKSLKWGMLVCHQSVLVKKEIIENYQLIYKHSSDFEWLIRMLKKSKRIYNSKLILSKFMDGGQTSKYLIAGLKERFRIMVKYYGLISTVFIHFILVAKMVVYYFKNKRI
jgi:glycosyltransferase involved in cell wall biosynthesis